MTLQPFPVVEALRARLEATATKATQLLQRDQSRAAQTAIAHATQDLNDAAALLEQTGVDQKPHVLRVVDTFIEVAEWRLRGVESAPPAR
jgi:predicted component of type VI protein secretion system